MRMSEAYGGGPCRLSFEIFPPKTPDGAAALYRAVDELAAHDPCFISCTYGAGGSTNMQTLDICSAIKSKHRVPCTAHFTCLGGTLDEIRTWLREAERLGVENIMALRGDPPKGVTSFQQVDGGLRHACDLVRLIKREFPSFGIGVAGYPEKHVEAPSHDVDLANLKAKVDEGADAIFTQLFYDNDDFHRFRDRCEAVGIKTPIIPGLLPILSLSQVNRITGMCGSRLPDELRSRLEAAGDDPAKQVEVGVDHAARQYRELQAAGVPGVHFYVLNRADAIRRILADVRRAA